MRLVLGLDRVFHRAAAVDRDLERRLAPLRREEIVQLLVEAELGERFYGVEVMYL
jgi:hypothetical protein